MSRERDNPLMGKHLRRFICTGLVPASLLLATSTGATAQGHEEHADMAMEVPAPATMTLTVAHADVEDLYNENDDLDPTKVVGMVMILRYTLDS